VLRKFTEADATDVFMNWACDGRVTKFLSFEPHENIDTTKKVLANWVNEYTDKNIYNWAIVFNGKVIGRIHSSYVNRDWNFVEVGYAIGYDYWGKGIASEALLCVMDYFFHKANMNRIYAMYDAENPASGRVMQKCGMQYEGNMRQHFLRRDCTYSDGLIYGILKDEFDRNIICK